MKRFFRGVAIVITALFLASALFPIESQAAGSKHEKVWWIVGTIKGNKPQQEVITLRLVRKGQPDDNYVSVTSTNKFNQYAFSNPEEGQPPSAYKLVLFVGYNRVMEVPLDGVKAGGRVPPITINW